MHRAHRLLIHRNHLSPFHLKTYLQCLRWQDTETRRKVSCDGVPCAGSRNCLSHFDLLSQIPQLLSKSPLRITPRKYQSERLTPTDGYLVRRCHVVRLGLYYFKERFHQQSREEVSDYFRPTTSLTLGLKTVFLIA